MWIGRTRLYSKSKSADWFVVKTLLAIMLSWVSQLVCRIIRSIDWFSMSHSSRLLPIFYITSTFFFIRYHNWRETGLVFFVFNFFIPRFQAWAHKLGCKYRAKLWKCSWILFWHADKVSGKVIDGCRIIMFNLSLICTFTFSSLHRWTKHASGYWVGVIGQNAYKLRQTENHVEYQVHSPVDCCQYQAIIHQELIREL